MTAENASRELYYNNWNEYLIIHMNKWNQGHNCSSTTKHAHWQQLNFTEKGKYFTFSTTTLTVGGGRLNGGLTNPEDGNEGGGALTEPEDVPLVVWLAWSPDPCKKIDIQTTTHLHLHLMRLFHLRLDSSLSLGTIKQWTFSGNYSWSLATKYW